MQATAGNGHFQGEAATGGRSPAFAGFGTAGSPGDESVGMAPDAEQRSLPQVTVLRRPREVAAFSATATLAREKSRSVHEHVPNRSGDYAAG